MFTSIFNSFVNAWRGIRFLFQQDWNMRFHLFAALGVVILGLFFHVSYIEWCMLLLAISLVMAAEGINTAIEKLADRLHPEQHPIIGQVKDMAAGAVLLAAFFAAIIGLLIFGKHIAVIFL